MAPRKLEVFFRGDHTSKAMKTRIEAPVDWPPQRVLAAFLRTYQAKRGLALKDLALYDPATGNRLQEFSSTTTTTTQVLEARPPTQTFRVDLKDTILRGLGYVGADQFPPPTAGHCVVFRGIRVGDYVRVVGGEYANLLLPTMHAGNTVLRLVPDDTPLDPRGRPRTPVNVEATEVSDDVKQQWAAFWEMEKNRPEEYYEKARQKVRARAKDIAANRGSPSLDPWPSRCGTDERE